MKPPPPVTRILNWFKRPPTVVLRSTRTRSSSGTGWMLRGARPHRATSMPGILEPSRWRRRRAMASRKRLFPMGKAIPSLPMSPRRAPAGQSRQRHPEPPAHRVPRPSEPPSTRFRNPSPSSRNPTGQESMLQCQEMSGQGDLVLLVGFCRVPPEMAMQPGRWSFLPGDGRIFPTAAGTICRTRLRWWAQKLSSRINQAKAAPLIPGPDFRALSHTATGECKPFLDTQEICLIRRNPAWTKSLAARTRRLRPLAESDNLRYRTSVIMPKSAEVRSLQRASDHQKPKRGE